MADTLTSAALAAAALAVVLAVAAAWSADAEGHLGLGATIGVAIVLGQRLDALQPLLAAVAVLTGGGALGAGAWILDRRLRRLGAPLWFGAVAVLAAGLGLAEVLRPPVAVPIPGTGALGRPPATLGVIAGFILAGAFLVWRVRSAGSEELVGVVRWALTGAVGALVATLAAGTYGAAPVGPPGLGGQPDTVGLALRAAAAALVARDVVGGSHARVLGVAAALGAALGVFEGALLATWPTGGIGSVPVLLMVLGWTVHHARSHQVPRWTAP